MRIALVTDAWAPQVNGVVRTLSQLFGGLTAAGHQVLAVTPDLFPTVPCPTDPTIRLAVATRRILARLLDSFAPDTIHIAPRGRWGLPPGPIVCSGGAALRHRSTPSFLNT